MDQSLCSFDYMSADAGEAFGTAYAVEAGSRRLIAGEQTQPKPDAPPLAP